MPRFEAPDGAFELSYVDRPIGAADFPATETDCGDFHIGATKLPIFHRVASHTRQ
jgi:hypothetical protein